MMGSLVLAVSLFKQLFDTIGTIVSTTLTWTIIVALVASAVFALWVWHIMKHVMASARMQPWEKKYPPHDHKPDHEIEDTVERLEIAHCLLDPKTIKHTLEEAREEDEETLVKKLYRALLKLADKKQQPNEDHDRDLRLIFNTLKNKLEQNKAEKALLQKDLRAAGLPLTPAKKEKKAHH